MRLALRGNLRLGVRSASLARATVGAPASPRLMRSHLPVQVMVPPGSPSVIGFTMRGKGGKTTPRLRTQGRGGVSLPCLTGHAQSRKPILPSKRVSQAIETLSLKRNACKIGSGVYFLPAFYALLTPILPPVVWCRYHAMSMFTLHPRQKERGTARVLARYLRFLYALRTFSIKVFRLRILIFSLLCLVRLMALSIDLSKAFASPRWITLPGGAFRFIVLLL